MDSKTQKLPINYVFGNRFEQKHKKKFGDYVLGPIFALPNKQREHSSAGLEHLPYKQRVRGSNPCAPTQYGKWFQEIETIFISTYFNTITPQIRFKCQECFLIIISQIPIKEWCAAIGENILAYGIQDSVIHNSL